MPLPPLDPTKVEENPSFQFSHAECLLYALHSLGKQCPEYFSFSNDQQKLKDYRSRLQYLARGTQGYIKSLQESIKGKTSDELKTDENQIKITALKTTSNISTLIRDLFHSPPIFKTAVQLSWITKKTQSPNAKDRNSTSETTTTTAAQATGAKRHAPITFDGDSRGGGGVDNKKSKNNSDQKVYAPPSGKYSGKVQNYSNRNNRNNRSGGGGFRGNSKPYRRY